jgi:hypothetical protein
MNQMYVCIRTGKEFDVAVKDPDPELSYRRLQDSVHNPALSGLHIACRVKSQPKLNLSPSYKPWDFNLLRFFFFLLVPFIFILHCIL